MTACLNATSAREARSFSRSCSGSSVSRSSAITEHDRAKTRLQAPSAHAAMDALQQRDHAGLADALPGQAQHEGIELGMRECQRATDILGPDELAAIQTPRGQPHADAVMHEHRHAVGTTVGEQVGMVWSGGTEHGDHTRQRRFGAAADVQWLDGQPDRLNLDHARGSPQDLPQASCTRACRAHRPAHAHGERAALQFDLGELLSLGRRRRRGRHGHRHEGRCWNGTSTRRASPLVHEVGIESVAQRDLGDRGTGHLALGKHPLLQLLAVPAARAPLGVLVGVHLTSLVDTILAGAPALSKMGWPDAYGATSIVRCPPTTVEQTRLALSAEVREADVDGALPRHQCASTASALESWSHCLWPIASSTGGRLHPLRSSFEEGEIMPNAPAGPAGCLATHTIKDKQASFRAKGQEYCFRLLQTLDCRLAQVLSLLGPEGAVVRCLLGRCHVFPEAQPAKFCEPDVSHLWGNCRAHERAEVDS